MLVNAMLSSELVYGLVSVWSYLEFKNSFSSFKDIYFLVNLEFILRVIVTEILTLLLMFL